MNPGEAVAYVVDILQAPEAILQTAPPSCSRLPVTDARLLFCDPAKPFANLLELLDIVGTPQLSSYSRDGVFRLDFDGLSQKSEHARVQVD